MRFSAKSFFFFSLFFLSIYCFPQEVGAQPTGQFDLFQGKKSIDIPFEYKNGFIVVRLTLAGLLPMKFILDTGAESTILAKKEIAEVLGLRFEKEYRIVGSDMRTELIAYVTRQVAIKVGGMRSPYNDLLVLDKDYLRFEEYLGEQIYGILGANFFRHFVMHIDFRKQVITLTAKANFKSPGKKYVQVPVNIQGFRPFLSVDIKLHNDSIVKTKLLLDTGASLALLLHNATHPDLKLPPNTIEGKVGMGLGGLLEGYLGRIRSLDIGQFRFDNILTNYQDIDFIRDTSYLKGRNGVIGTSILSRFNLIIDYPEGKLYLRPLRKWNRGFRYDRSGLSVIATGKHLNEYSINHVIKNSPADKAGLKAGDVILKVNSMPARLLGLLGITRRLQKKEGKKTKVKIKRDGKKMKFVFRLENLI